MANPTTFRCTLVTPEKQVLDEEVSYASIPAFDGQLGVAPMRAPLLAKLGDGTLKLEVGRGETQWYFVAGGFAQMKDNKLTLLTEECIPAEEVSAESAGKAMTDAKALPAKDQTQQKTKARKLDRARALASLK